MNRELLFSLTAKDFKFQYYRGSGKGGQKRNKTSNCCRCIHIESGATSTSEQGRSQILNKQNAFRKCCETDIFKKWHKLEVAKKTGRLAIIKEEARVWAEKEINTPSHLKIEYLKERE